MARIRLLIAYSGFGFYGWQKQRGQSTIQGALEKALRLIAQKRIAVTGAGRTDAGAHAFAQTAHFDWPGPWPKTLCIQAAFNSFLPPGIRVKKAWKAPVDFHAQRSALYKSYIYIILNSPVHNVFRWPLVHWHPHKMDLKVLQKMSMVLKGRHNFKSFQNSGTDIASTVRTVYQARWIQKKNLFIFYVRGDGFLKQMVRNLAGAQLALLKSKNPVSRLQAVLLAKNRSMGLKTASAKGLYLYKVHYPPELDNRCRPL